MGHSEGIWPDPRQQEPEDSDQLRNLLLRWRGEPDQAVHVSAEGASDPRAFDRLAWRAEHSPFFEDRT